MAAPGARFSFLRQAQKEKNVRLLLSYVFPHTFFFLTVLPWVTCFLVQTGVSLVCSHPELPLAGSAALQGRSTCLHYCPLLCICSPSPHHMCFSSPETYSLPDHLCRDKPAICLQQNAKTKYGQIAPHWQHGRKRPRHRPFV